MPTTNGSMMVRRDVLMSVAAAMRADAADLDAAIERLACGQHGVRPMTRPTRPGS